MLSSNNAQKIDAAKSLMRLGLRESGSSGKSRDSKLSQVVSTINSSPKNKEQNKLSASDKNVRIVDKFKAMFASNKKASIHAITKNKSQFAQKDCQDVEQRKLEDKVKNKSS